MYFVSGNLFELFARLRAPGETIGDSPQPHHPQPMIFGIAARVAYDNQMITGFQGFPCDTLLAKQSTAAPFDRVLDLFAFVVLALDMDERMRIAEDELNEITLDRLLLVFEVGGSKGMVTIDLNAGQEACYG